MTSLEQAEQTALNNEAANLIEAAKPMYGIHYGSLYERDLDVKEIAKRIRTQLRKLSKAKHSPLFGAKVSVRIDRYSMGQSVDVYLDLPFTVDNPDYDHMSADPAEREYLTPKAKAAKQEAKTYLNAYNYDGSDTMTDYYHVNFSGHVRVDEMKEEAK